jgi:predicted transcriptional regulator
MNAKRALSIRQPFAEQIMNGKKKYEHRSGTTRIRERVYVYASKTPAPIRFWKGTGFKPGQLPTGVIVGTVEIVGCEGHPPKYAWKLAQPKRLKRKIIPRNKPQPVWFHPF